MGVEKDLPPGEKLVACFRPFLDGLVASDLSPKTIQKHVDNLWALGGEIIRDLHENPSLRRKSIEQILGDRIDEDGARWSTPWNRRRTNSVPSTPHARSFTASSVNRVAERSNSPTNSADEARTERTENLKNGEFD
jgi:hypothetical protein